MAWNSLCIITVLCSYILVVKTVWNTGTDSFASLLVFVSWHACTATEVQIGLPNLLVCGCFQVVLLEVSQQIEQLLLLLRVNYEELNVQL